VKGRTEKSARLLAGIVKARDPSADFIYHERTHLVCDIELQRAGRKPLRLRCTMADDVPKILKGGDNWQNYPTDMLSAFTMRRVCRLGAPELITALNASHSVSEAPEEYVDSTAELVSETKAIEGAIEQAEVALGGEPARVVDKKTGEITEPAAPEQRPDPLADLAAHFTKLGITTRLERAQWLGYARGTTAPTFQEGWLVPARDAGMTDDRIVEVTIDALDRVAKAVKGGGGKPARSLPEAVEYVAPRSLIGREMDDAKKAKAEAPAAGSVAPEDVPFDQEGAPAAEDEAKQPELV